MAAVKCRCPRIDVLEWEEKEFDWENKTFYFLPIKFLPIKFLLHKPFGLEEKIKQLRNEVAQKGYEFINMNVTLCEWASLSGRLMTQIKNPEKYDANIQVFDMGKVYTTVFKGKSKELKQAVNDFISQIELNHGIPVQKAYLWYAHCKVCAKERENVTVLFVKT